MGTLKLLVGQQRRGTLLSQVPVGGPAILDALATHHAKALFFLTGDFLHNPDFGQLVRRMVGDGHYVGPHSDEHRLYCSWEAARRRLVTRDEFEADVENNYRALAPFARSMPSSPLPFTNLVGRFISAPIRWVIPRVARSSL